MKTAHVSSVNVVHALVPDTRGDLDLTAIDKRARDGRVHVGPVGLHGDDQYDKRNHGGVEQAVYAYAREDAQWWANELGYEITPGRFGENLSTDGLDVTGAVLGERWRVGDDGLMLEVSSPRVPCATFQGWMDEPHWVKRFTDHGAPGAYLRVITEGTVGEVFAIRSVETDRLLRALGDTGVRGEMADVIRRDLAARARKAVSR